MNNNISLRKTLLTGFITVAAAFNLNAVVPARVNTGDPAFPFPQFMDYSPECKSLATHNAPGVTHAEMEKRMLDAWQHICNNTITQPYEVDGVQYLIPDQKNAETHCACAEGDGYYLLPSAIFGDKAYFDGYYMSMHDRMFIGVERFYDGGTNRYDGYTKGLNGSGSFGAGASMELGSYGGGEASATDGDVDIALALLIAAKQWGEHSGIQTRFGELNYKEEALKYIRAMVDPVEYNGLGCYVSGDVGFDGYLKGGSHQANLTGWMTRGSGKTYKGYVPENGGTQMLYFDYLAPAYFNEYAKFLQEDSESTEWQISQCLRCEASSDYLMRKLYEVSDNTIPVCGQVTSVSDTEFKFDSGQFAEDFRAGWRTILNYVWHGNPTTTWNPVSHEVEDGSNSYEKDMAMRYAQFLANPQDAKWGNDCNAIGDMGLKFWGPYTLRDKMDMYGQIGDGFPLNWIHGAGSPAAVAAQDFELMGQMFRHCIIAWDDENFASYETSTPHYFHEWFKLLGMLVLSGNFQAPSKMVPQANCKVYHKVDKTYAFAGDEVEFTITIRNYGSADAKNTIVKFGIPAGFDFVSSDKGKISGDSVVWDRGLLSGFKTKTGLEPTIDSMKVVCRLNDNIEQGRYCTTARIECKGGTGWTSDEYPNNITDVMERNCVDVVARALKIDKKANRDKINPDNIAQFKINFENSAEAGWINGGRPGVRLSYGHLPVANPSATDQIVSFYRLFNDADEAYINYGNYRVSYYMYDPSLVCFTGSDDCNIGWTMACDYYQGGLKEALKISHETTVEGTDPETGKKYNQRIIVQFADQLATVSQHLQQYASAGEADGLHVHEGGGSTLLLNMRMACSQGGKLFDLTDDWSYSDEWESAKQNDLHHPIVNDHTDPNNIDQPITSWDRHSCGTPSNYCDRILVEEWDGYTWRRVLGNGPKPGRDVYNVVLRDTLPKGMEFVEFVGACPLEEFGGSWKTEKTSDGRDVVVWTINRMMIEQKGTITYNANITFPSGAECKTDDEDIINKAWIWGDKESKIFGADTITVTCAKVPDPIIPSTLVKTVDKEKVNVDDDIEYTLEYEQTHGAIFDKAEANASDWTLKDFSISGGNLSTVSNQTGSAQYKYSKGKNYHVKMDLNPATYATFQILLRQGSSNPISLEIKPDLSQNILMVTTYQGSTVKQATQEVIFKGSNDPISMILDLSGDLLRMWVNKDTTSGEIYSVSGLADGEGYVGFKNGGMNGGDSYGIHKFSNIHVHTDYAYDLSIIDRKPEEIKFISADEGGELQGDSIVWKFEQGIDNPIPFGTKYKVTWKGKVENCNELVINYAYARLLGHKDGEIAAQAESECIDESCEGVEKAEISIKDAEICAGDSTVLKAVGTPTSSKYEYEFFLGNTSLGKASSVDSFVVKEMGDYKVKISDPSCPTASAVTSKSVSLVVNALPDEEITDKAVICKGEDLKLGDVTVDDHTIEWFADINKAIEVDAKDIPADDVRNTYYYVLTDEATGCKGEVKEWDVVINDVPSTPTVKPEKELPLKDGVSENITNMASASGSGNYVVWYKDETAAIKDSVKAPILVDLSNEGKVTYYVREKSPEGCIGDIVPVSVVITSSQKPNPNDTTICVGEEIDVTTLVEVETGSSLIWYDENGNETTAPGLYSSNTAGVKEFTVAQTNGTAISEKSTFSVTTVEVADLKDDVINYCAGETAVELKATVNTSSSGKTPTSYNWYIKGQPTTDLIPATDVTASKLYSYEVEPVYEIAKGHTCVGEKASVEVNVEFVAAVMPDHAIHYTLSDAVGGKFPTLTEQDPTAVVPTTDKKLVWYDANENLIGETAPSPDMVTEDATVTYKVKQVSKNGCESEFQEVTVIITKTPIPTTTIAYYCDGETPDPIEQFASVSDNSYSLIWYDDDPKKGGTTLSSAPVIDATVNPGEVETVRKYYVAQGNATETSSANVVEVHIFAKPRLITRDSASCESPVDINGLWSDISKKVEFTTFYTALGGTLGQDELVTKSGTYRVEGGFNIGVSPNIKECRSEKSPIKIEVHSLGTVEIEGPDAVCPNTAVELKVLMTDEDIFDSTLTYVWNKPNNSTVEKEFLSDPIKQATTFSVTISDGACTKKYDKEVGINNGLIDGIIEISEADNDNSPVKMNASADGAKFHSCGGDVTILADVAGSDFVWQDGTTGNTVTKKGGVYKLTYKDANGCETGFAVEIVPNPIVDNTLAFDTTLCEGENVTLSLDITAGIETPEVVWKKNGTEISTDATIVLKKVTTAEAGEYTYEATNRGCRTTGTFGTLTVLPRPTYTIKDVDVVCAGESEEIGLETLSPATAEVEWTPSPSLVSTGNTAVVTPEQDETYSFTISQNGGCKIMEKISVKVAQPIDFKIAANDTTICENNVGNLKFGLKIVDGDVLSYEWKNEKDEVVSTSSVLKFSEKEVGTYKYTAKLTSEACPSVTDDIEVAIVGVPLVDTVTKIDYHNVEFVPNENYGEAPYEYKVDANEFSTSAEAYVTYGYHTVVIKDQNGCMSSYEFVTEAPDFEIPTLVTPNGDGVNDAFISDVIAEAYPDAVVTIYDRFGKKLVEMKGNEAWDGTYLGRKMPATDYWYEIWIDEIRKKYVGHFTLIND